MISVLLLIAGTAAAAPTPARQLVDKFGPPTTEELAAIVDVVDQVAADGPSTRYKLLEVGHDPGGTGIGIFCGYANTKNKLGAYVGWEMLSGALIPDLDTKRLSATIEVVGEAAETFCKSLGYKVEGDR